MKLKKILSCFLLLSIQILFGQVKNIGLPEIRNFKRTEYKGETQNWNIDQDKNGNIYFANNSGLFQFDGASWHKFTIPNSNSIRSLKIDDSGRIFVGGYNEFGYFNPGVEGKLTYFSLSNSVKTSDSKIIDFIWKIHVLKNEVIFQTFEKAYIYKNNIIRILEAPKKFQFSFIVNEKLYFQDASNGIMEYRNGELFSLPNTEILNTTEVWGMFEIPENKIVIATIDKGLFLYENEKITPWNTEANDFIKKNNCLGGAMIKNTFIVINSVLDGVIICNNDGQIIQHINRKNGLQNNTVLTSFIDSKNNLWLGLDNGITFINENSPFTSFGNSFDISTVYASVVYYGNIYVATNQGVFYHKWGGNFKDDSFTLVEGTTGQAWNIQVLDDQLLCAHNKGAILIKPNQSIEILNNKGFWGFKKISNNPNYIIGSGYEGFSLFEKKESGWKFKNKIQGYTKSVNKFEIDNQYIWFKKDEITFQLELNETLRDFKSIRSFKNISEKIKGIGSIQKLKNHLSFQINNQFYSYSKEQDLFFEDKKTSVLFKGIPAIKSLNEDKYGNIWYFYGESLGVLMNQGLGKYKNISAPFSNLTGKLVSNYESVNTISPNNIFIGLTDGLAHYDSGLLQNSTSKPVVFIRNFSFSNDTLVFGNGKRPIEKIDIPYSSNHVKFTFSSPSFENVENVVYSYKLEGFDDRWSNWATSPMKEYTYLREGDYKMKVRVKNSFGIISDESIIAFTVSPPWYRHFLAYLFYLIVIVISILALRQRVNIKIRKNKYYETVEQRRLYLEKESKIKEEQFELEKEIERLKNDKLQIKILLKDKELVNNTLQVVKKNKILNGIIHKLKDINVETFDESTKFQFTKLNKSIVKEVNADHSWKDLEKHIKNVHFDFLKRLKEKYPTISPRELDLSTYLLMNMSTKEIAEIMNISSGGVELARYRLRKKLELNKKENLIGFLMGI
jgi:ligand-binding sensor domain-containing protein/DNA-binding CsgD family transcriptional regulator